MEDILYLGIILLFAGLCLLTCKSFKNTNDFMGMIRNDLYLEERMQKYQQTDVSYLSNNNYLVIEISLEYRTLKSLRQINYEFRDLSMVKTLFRHLNPKYICIHSDQISLVFDQSITKSKGSLFNGIANIISLLTEHYDGYNFPIRYSIIPFNIPSKSELSQYFYWRLKKSVQRGIDDLLWNGLKSKRFKEDQINHLMKSSYKKKMDTLRLEFGIYKVPPTAKIYKDDHKTKISPNQIK